jgi:hypothetical protein
MARVDLRVPFEDKDIVKRLGARWDADARVWYVPAGADASRFGRWLAEDSDINVRSSSFFLARSQSICPKCGRWSAVHGFILPAGHETLYVGDHEDEDCWEVNDEPTLLSHISYLSAEVAALMTQVTPFYRLAPSLGKQEFHHRNFCEHCVARFDDRQLFDEPGEGFLAFTLEDAIRVHLTLVERPFEANSGSFSIGVALFEDMTRLETVLR